MKLSFNNADEQSEYLAKELQALSQEMNEKVRLLGEATGQKLGTEIRILFLGSEDQNTTTEG